MLHAIVIGSSVVLLAQAQSLNGAFNNNILCNGTFAQANATGVFSYNPHVDQGSQAGQPDNHSGRSKPIDLVYTVTQNQNDSRLQASTWINLNGANYSDDFSLGYDVCGMNFGPLLENTISRGQSDNGSCLSTFNQPCVNAIEFAAQRFALELTLTPTPLPNSNLTRTSLPTVCNDIGMMLTSKLPTLEECKPFFNRSVAVDDATALSGYNTSITTGNTCKANGSFYEVQTYYFDYSSSSYADYTQGISPILAIWMPIANAARPGTIQYADAGLICAHVTQFSTGSVVPAALPAPTPIKNDGRRQLSGGAIAGIVIGVLVGVALIVGGVLAWFIGKRRRTKKAETERDVQNEKALGPDVEASPATFSEEGRLVELPPGNLRPELEAGKRIQIHELGAQQEEARELMGQEEQAPAIELEGSAPSVEKE